MNDRRSRALALATLVLAAATPARAHEFKLDSVITAFLRIAAPEAHLVVRVPLHVAASIPLPLNGREIDLARADEPVDRMVDALARDLALWEGAGGPPLAPSSRVARLALPSDRSFDRYEDAADAVAHPPPRGTVIYAGQGFLDAHLSYPIASPSSRFSVRTAVAPELREFLKVAIRFEPLGERGSAMVITSRSGRVALNPAWYQAAASFVGLGVEHILSGLDHLLFLLCVVLPLAGMRRILAVVTAFTAAHSLTLVAAAYGAVPGGGWFPPFVETAIAASILYTALENAVAPEARRRWLVAGLFGLVHGFGFSYGLKENLQFAGSHLLVSLLSFNVGIELGQIAALGVALPAIALLRRLVRARRAVEIAASALVAHTAWHWLVERGTVLWKMDWPALDAAALAILARWALIALLVWGAVRLWRRPPAAIARLLRRGRARPDVPVANP